MCYYIICTLVGTLLEVTTQELPDSLELRFGELPDALELHFGELRCFAPPRSPDLRAPRCTGASLLELSELPELRLSSLQLPELPMCGCARNAAVHRSLSCYWLLVIGKRGRGAGYEGAAHLR